MQLLSYEVLIGLIFLLSLFFIANNWFKYVLFRSHLEMSVDLQFQEAASVESHLLQGNIGLQLSKADERIKGVLITRLSINNSDFSISPIDQLYFKADKPRYLSVSFRIRRHNLRKLEGHSIRVYITGRMTLKDGSVQMVKAKKILIIGDTASFLSTATVAAGTRD